jgi:hypothetical protein
MLDLQPFNNKNKNRSGVRQSLGTAVSKGSIVSVPDDEDALPV